MNGMGSRQVEKEAPKKNAKAKGKQVKPQAPKKNEKGKQKELSGSTKTKAAAKRTNKVFKSAATIDDDDDDATFAPSSSPMDVDVAPCVSLSLVFGTSPHLFHSNNPSFDRPYFVQAYSTTYALNLRNISSTFW